MKFLVCVLFLSAVKLFPPRIIISEFSIFHSLKLPSLMLSFSPLKQSKMEMEREELSALHVKFYSTY